MTGSLQVKKDKFYAVLNLYENGKRKPKWIATGLPVKNNKLRAEAMLRDLLREYEQRESLVHSDSLFSDYIRYWLRLVAGRVDAVTLQGYETIANTQILPYFDALGVKLTEVTRTILQAYIDQKSASGRLDGKGGLSPSSMRLHKNILRQTLAEAVTNNLLPANPCDSVTLPKQQRYDSTYYTADQMARLFDAIRDDPLYPLVKLTAIYGLRRSELLGLKWDSVNLEAGTLTIRHTVVKVTDVVEKDKTKNAASHRTFPLVPEVRDILLAAKASEERNRKLFGKDYTENGYIFKWEDGRPYSPDFISHKFSKLLKQHGLPHIRFHELRHSCASLLITQGFTLKDVQEWMGHSDIKMTANIYAHLDVARKVSMADTLAGSLAGKC